MIKDLLKYCCSCYLFFVSIAATVEFARSQYSVLEKDLSVTVTLNLTGVLDQNTTVRYVSYFTFIFEA